MRLDRRNAARLFDELATLEDAAEAGDDELAE